MTAAWQAKRYAMDARAARDAALYFGEMPLSAMVWDAAAEHWDAIHVELHAEEEAAAKVARATERAAAAHWARRQRVWSGLGRFLAGALAAVVVAGIVGVLAWILAALVSVWSLFGWTVAAMVTLAVVVAVLCVQDADSGSRGAP